MSEAKIEAAGNYIKEKAYELIIEGEFDDLVKEMILDGDFDDLIMDRVDILMEERELDHRIRLYLERILTVDVLEAVAEQLWM